MSEGLAAQAGLPWPAGDAPGLRGAVGMMTAAAEQLTTAGSLLWPMSAADAGWTGSSGPVFDAAVAAEVAALNSAATDLGIAADAVTTLAAAVEAAQETVGLEAQKVLDAEAAEAGASDPMAPEGPYPDPGTVRAAALGVAEDAVSDVALADAAAAESVGAVAAPLGGTGAMPSPPATPLAMVVAGAYAPVYRFDGDEDHHPGNVQDWIANAELLQRDDGTWYYDPEGEDIRNGDLDTATLPVTYHVTDDGELQLEYGLFYPFNDFPGAGNFDPPGNNPLVPDVPSVAKPDHEGDFEPFTVQFGYDGRPEAADFESHGHTRVRPWDDVETTDDGRPIVYPSHGAHGNNPEAGQYDDGPAPDVLPDNADGEGDEWDSAPVLVDANSIPELQYDANFGEDKDQGRGNPKSFLDQEPPPDLDGDDDNPDSAPAGPYPEPSGTEGEDDDWNPLW